MNFASVEKIADAVLYEGYMLYPYRPSAIKNRQRWNFGTLYPRAFAQSLEPSDAWRFQAEVLIEGSPESVVEARVRFLHLVPPADGAVDGWDEGFSRSRTVCGLSMASLLQGVVREFGFSELAEEEATRSPASFRPTLAVGVVSLRAEAVYEGLYRLRVEFANETPCVPAELSRRSAQSLSFTSAHLLLHVAEGAFVSALDSAADLAQAVAACVNTGVFPVLVGEEGGRNLMLCSPIILYDYPKTAPESEGNFFDGTEMDEMLALRVMTLTDSEQDEMRRSDPHARAILERLETLPKEHLLKVHGAVRGMRPLETGAARDDQINEIDGVIEVWDPFAERPAVESVKMFGVELRVGDRVRLWPQKKADIMDMALRGKAAIIQAIEQDLEDRIQFAVVIEDDPGRDLGMLRKAAHRFFFSPEEVEPLAGEPAAMETL
jgi:hypothetical protein